MAIKLGREVVRTLCAGVVVHLMVVSACSAGGGGEDPSDVPSAKAPTRLDGSGLGEEVAAQGEEQAQPDGGARAPSLFLPVKEAKANESGSRLKARYYSGADGSKQFLNWYDSQLDTQCSFTDLGDGLLRCAPPAIAVPRYADANCMQLVFATVTSACGETEPTIGRAPYVGANGSCSTQYRYYEPGAKTTPAKIYAWSGSVCLENPVDPKLTYWFAGAELPVSSFVSGEIVTE